jgi:hypothetical protein
MTGLDDASVPLVVGAFPDGSVLVRHSLIQPPREEGKLERSRIVLAIHDANGSLVSSLGNFPGSERYAVSYSAGISLNTHEFGRMTSADTRGERP